MNNRLKVFNSFLLLLACIAAAPSAFAADEPKPGLEVPETIEVFRIYPCKHCDELEAFFTREGIPYRKYDLKKDKNAESDYLRHIGRGLLPVTRVNRRHVRGFKPLQVLKLIQGEAIEPPAPGELLQPGPTPVTTEQPKESPQEIAKKRYGQLKGLVERAMAHYDQAAKPRGGEDKLLYSEMARPEIEARMIGKFGTNEKVIKHLASGRDKRHYDKTVAKYITLAKRKVRKRHGRMIAINKRLLKKWKEPLDQEVASEWSQLSADILAEEIAKATPEDEENGDGSDAKTAKDKTATSPRTKPERAKPKAPKKEEIIIVR